MKNLTELFVAFRFGIVGALATLIHLVVSMLAAHWLFDTALFANLFGYCVGLPFSYLGHSYFTFSRKPDARHFIQFALSNTGLLAVSLGTAYFLDSIDCDKYVSTAISVLVFPVLSFLLHSKITFKKNI